MTPRCRDCGNPATHAIQDGAGRTIGYVCEFGAATAVPEGLTARRIARWDRA